MRTRVIRNYPKIRQRPPSATAAPSSTVNGSLSIWTHDNYYTCSKKSSQSSLVLSRAPKFVGDGIATGPYRILETHVIVVLLTMSISWPKPPNIQGMLAGAAAIGESSMKPSIEESKDNSEVEQNAPIFHIPAEIRLRIFELIPGPPTKLSYLPASASWTLTRICKSLEKIVSGTPSWWCNLRFPKSLSESGLTAAQYLEIINITLDRSGSHYLNFSINLEESKPSANFLRLLVDVRLHSADVIDHPSRNFVFSPRTSYPQTPSYVGGNEAQVVGHPYDVVHFPQIRVLNVEHPSVFCRLSITGLNEPKYCFSNDVDTVLKFLAISRCNLTCLGITWTTEIIDTGPFVTLLQKLPNLQHLKIHNLCSYYDDQLDVYRALRLGDGMDNLIPNLQELTLHLYDPFIFDPDNILVRTTLFESVMLSRLGRLRKLTLMQYLFTIPPCVENLRNEGINVVIDWEVDENGVVII
ncbi:hypothetical protein IW262DRAFT_1299043 [Armillaria fumosa]|nr:hypothetical protein IW262DRAFT_1299043 [Armillaria fumosa]